MLLLLKSRLFNQLLIAVPSTKMSAFDGRQASLIPFSNVSITKGLVGSGESGFAILSEVLWLSLVVLPGINYAGGFTIVSNPLAHHPHLPSVLPPLNTNQSRSHHKDGALLRGITLFSLKSLSVGASIVWRCGLFKVYVKQLCEEC